MAQEKEDKCGKAKMWWYTFGILFLVVYATASIERGVLLLSSSRGSPITEMGDPLSFWSLIGLSYGLSVLNMGTIFYCWVKNTKQ